VTLSPKDPIQEKGGINLYGFVKNAPVNYVDIKGTFPCGGACLAAIGIGGSAILAYYADGCKIGRKEKTYKYTNCEVSCIKCKDNKYEFYTREGSIEYAKEQICKRNWIGKGVFYDIPGVTWKKSRECNAKCDDGDEIDDSGVGGGAGWGW
jgi:hypothetical protein